MLSRKSEIIAPRPWRATALANVPLVIAMLAMIPLGQLLEGSWGQENLDAYFTRLPILVGINIILAVSLQLINGYSGQFSLGHAGFMAVGAYMAAYPAIEYSQQFSNPGACVIFFVALGICVAIGATPPMILFILLRKTKQFHRSLPAALLIATVIWIVADIASAASAPKTPVWTIWTRFLAALENLYGWIVLHAGPIAGHLLAWLPDLLRKPACFVILLIGAGLCASAVGFIVGLPALRLRGDYLAIATLGFGEIIRIAITNDSTLGGALGLSGIPRYTDFTWLYICVIITVAVIWRVAYSPKGRAIMAVREDEIAASSIGINTTSYKVTAFTIGAFFAGLAGALYAMHESSITPSSFGIIKSIEPVVMVTLGGLGSISGAILAAIILTLLPEVLRSISPDERMVIYSLLLVVMMILRPQGLLGGRELWFGKWSRTRKPRTPAREAVPA